MNKNLCLDKIHSLQIRNLVRGMLANPSIEAMREGFKKIASLSSPIDYKNSVEILRQSQLFKANNISRYFPQKFSRPLQLPAYKPSEIISRFNQNKKKISNLILSVRKIIIFVDACDFKSALQAVRDLIQKEGVSIVLLRMAYLIKNRADHPNLSREIDAILDAIQSANVKYPQLAIRELSNPNTEYLNIREKISAAGEGAMMSIAKNFIDHIPRSEEQFEEVLNAYFGVSLLDAFSYYLSVTRCGLFAYSKFIDSDLVEAFNELAKLQISHNYPDGEDPGLIFFRDSLLLIELDECFRYKTCHSAIFNTAENRLFTRTPYESAILQEYFQSIKSINDVENFSDISRNSSDDAEPRFERSNALIYFLEQNDGVVEDEKTFVKLMSSTRDIGVICQKRYLQSMSQSATSDEFKLVVACLGYIKTRTQLNEHELRETIQEIAISKFGSNLTDLLDYLYVQSPAVTEHLVHVLDETFLTKLFDIVDRPNAAIEFRASIFEWYSAKTGDLSYLDRAKNLRIDVQINKAKGTIDDARIYVDPVKFTQWVTDNLLDELSILAAEICAKNEPSLVSVGWDKVKAGITDIEQVGAILLSAYEEFCSNNKFGIASYIGRRIRHGTLKGTGFNDVKVFPKRAEFAELFSSRDFEECFNAWLKAYESCLNQLRDKYVQIHDKKKPDGLFTKDLRTATKWVTANHMLYEVLNSFHHNKSGQELPYIIAEYCWRLVEEDLAGIRGFIMDQKAKYGVFRFDLLRDNRIRQRDVQEFSEELNTLVADRFRLIESWFNKPSIASPSAQLLLLFKAVVSEIQGFFADYNPQLVVDELGYVIRGGAYFVIYDALFIIIYNAAKYGKKDGKLCLEVLIEEREGAVNFKIAITSQLDADANMRLVRESISSALCEDFEDALIIEGRSGIKKLKRMEQDLYIRNVSYEFDTDEVTASFEFKLDYQS
jgi:hypothetical protein